VVIVRYSWNYLQGDPRHGVFLGWLAATVAGVELLVLAGNLATLVAAWIATSLALHRLLLFYPHRRGAVVAARKKFVVARLGDAALIGAAVLLYRSAGTGDLEQVFATARDAEGALGATGAAAVLIVVAAMLKSAQFPTHGWLVEVMETPTPVSALLHAGILNAGPFLVLRMADVVDPSDLAGLALILVGGLTATFASVVLLTQPTVKVALGYSSVAHMGFMLLICGLGVYAAALLHLVAHSFYKAHAFLSSGSVVEERRAAAVSVARRSGRPVRLAAGLIAAVGMYAAVARVLGIEVTSDAALLLVGAIFVVGTTQLLASSLDSHGTLGAMGRVAAAALAVTTSFFVLEAATHALLYDLVPHGGASGLQLVAAGLVLVVFAAVVALQLVEPVRPSGPLRARLAVHFRNGWYANAAFDRLVGAHRLANRQPAGVAEPPEDPPSRRTPSPSLRPDRPQEQERSTRIEVSA
jgi:NAD(P)H-quinone oxidoreductase subunit 5